MKKCKWCRLKEKPADHLTKNCREVLAAFGPPPTDKTHLKRNGAADSYTGPRRPTAKCAQCGKKPRLPQRTVCNECKNKHQWQQRKAARA